MILGFVVGLVAGAVVWVPIGWVLADPEGSYKHGLEDADRGWKASLGTDAPFRCNAVPLSPGPQIVVQFPDTDHLKGMAR